MSVKPLQRRFCMLSIQYHKQIFCLDFLLKSHVKSGVLILLILWPIQLYVSKKEWIIIGPRDLWKRRVRICNLFFSCRWHRNHNPRKWKIYVTFSYQLLLSIYRLMHIQLLWHCISKRAIKWYDEHFRLLMRMQPTNI